MYKRILVPIDGSEPSARGLAEAIALAKLTGGRLRLMHIVDELSLAMAASGYAGYTGELVPLLREGGQKILDEAKGLVARAGLEVEVVLRDSFAARVCDLVVDEATTWPADLIVIGTHGRRGAGRLFMGSDAEQILRVAPVPVLLVRQGTAVAAA